MTVQYVKDLASEPFGHGQHKVKSTWSFRDSDMGMNIDSSHIGARIFCHYSTPMLRAIYVDGEFYNLEPLSTGRGSVSDQAGMNTLFQHYGSAYRYYRDAKGGGPRVEA